MVRFLVRMSAAVIANAIGLIVAAWVLDDMSLGGTAFLLGVLLFTVVEMIALPVVQKAALRRSEALVGGSALIAVLIALIVTDVISDGLSISGVLTWLLATAIVWGATLVAAIILPATVFKKWLQERR